MKIITISLDDDTSGLVKHYLLALSAEEEVSRDFIQEQESLLDAIWQRHPSFTSAENLPREALYDRSES